MVRRATDDEIPDLHQIFRRLQLARAQPNVRLSFKDGRAYDGAITFVERLGTGRLINVDREFSMEFNIHDLSSVEF